MKRTIFLFCMVLITSHFIIAMDAAHYEFHSRYYRQGLTHTPPATPPLAIESNQKSTENTSIGLHPTGSEENESWCCHMVGLFSLLELAMGESSNSPPSLRKELRINP